MGNSTAFIVLPECTAQLPDGRFCGARSVEDAPFPICADHAEALVRWHEPQLTERMIRAVRSFPVQPSPPDLPSVRSGDVVYYCQLGNGRIKIGHTANLKTRMAEMRLTAGDVLATEPGGQPREAAVHRLFAHLRYGRLEEFEPDQSLLDHIDRVRAA